MEPFDDALEAARKHGRRLLLLFIAVNFAGLAADCTLAHWSIGFYHPGMYLSALWPAFAALVTAAFVLRKPGRFGKLVLYGTAGASLVVGFLGLLWHLSGQFFAGPAFASLIYSAPLFGPAVISVLGVTLYLYVRAGSADIFKPLMAVAAVSCLGLAIMAYQDHAQNEFWIWTEWVPVLTGVFSAVVLGFYAYKRPLPGAEQSLVLSVAVLALLVGVVGTVYHVSAFFSFPTPLKERFALLAPPFAPFLFCDAAVFIGLTGLWFRDTKEPT
jgi:pimeloyl-ACP methyl ester carboxylesterase